MVIGDGVGVNVGTDRGMGTITREGWVNPHHYWKGPLQHKHETLALYECAITIDLKCLYRSITTKEFQVLPSNLRARVVKFLVCVYIWVQLHNVLLTWVLTRTCQHAKAECINVFCIELQQEYIKAR